MPFLSSGELLQAVIDACRHRTEAVLFVQGHNPFAVSVDGREVTLFVANVSHARRNDPDEFRIQCPGDLPDQLAARRAAGDLVCILGYNADTDTFSAWDPERFVQRSRVTQRFSLYTRLSNHQRARTDGFSVYRDASHQNVLSFRSEFMALYVGNVVVMHQATDRALQNLVRAHRDTRSGVASRKLVTVAKRRVEITHNQYVRSPQFRQDVREAYQNRCAMCGVQLELIEAAHLVPHNHPKGLDTVSNGIALCALHHRSLDTGLIYLDANYSILINPVRRKYLVRMQRIDGFLKFRRQLSDTIALPHDPSDYPLRENIELGNQLRGIGVE